MNYLEYTVGKLMVDSFERGIVKYLGKQSSVGKKCECRLNSCYNSLENTLHYLKENYADRLYCFNVDSLRSSDYIEDTSAFLALMITAQMKRPSAN